MSSRLLRFAPVFLAIAGCQVIAGVETRTVDPLVDACALPSVGEGRIRVANVVPNDARVDFCVRPTGGAYFRPVLRGGGTKCPNGFGYGDVSAPFAVPVGRIDVKAIAAGQTCAAPALSEITSVDVGADLGVTIVRMGTRPEQLVTFAETTPASGSQAKLRFVHGAAGLGPLYIGTASNPRLPTDVGARFVAEPIAYGAGFSPKSHTTVGTIDASGYLVIPPTEVAVGFAVDGTTKAVIEANLNRTPTVRSVFAIGDPSSSSYPVRGLVCEDAKTASLVAGQNDGLATSCTLTSLATLSVDIFNLALYGANAAEEDARRPVMFAEIAKRTSDVQCLVEISRKTDRDVLIAATKTAFPSAITLDSDLNTQPTDPTDQNGNTPALPTTPPCGAAQAADLDATMSCITNLCSDGSMSRLRPGDGSDCLSSKCLAKLLPLYNYAPRCFDCVIVKTTSYTPLTDVKTQCSTDTHDPYNFGGQNPSMVLSRYPVANTDVFVFPSWLYRRAVIYTQLQLEQGTSVDFYCAQLTSTGIGGLLPYVGYYGNGAADSHGGYAAEQLLQVNKLIAWVKKKSGDRPAIIAGDWHASIAQASPRLDELEPTVYQTLGAAFAEALPMGTPRSCTSCATAQNRYNGDSSYNWLATFTSKFPANAATDANVYFNDTMAVTLSDASKGPLSPTFGWNVRVVRP